MSQVYSPLTSNSKVSCRFTHAKTQQEQGGGWKSLRNAITFLTGAPPRGRTLLSWSVIRRPRIWWKNTSTVPTTAINVSLNLRFCHLKYPVVSCRLSFLIGSVFRAFISCRILVFSSNLRLCPLFSIHNRRGEIPLVIKKTPDRRLGFVWLSGFNANYYANILDSFS